MKKIIFLDVDGVLNIHNPPVYFTLQYWKDDDIEHVKYLERHLVANLNRLVKETGAEIVISSSWRTMMEKLKEDLEKAGFQHWDKVIGRTPSIDRGTRGQEILEWVEMYQNASDEAVHYVVLEDENDVHEIPEEYLIKIDPRDGLTSKDTDRAIQILGKETYV